VEAVQALLEAGANPNAQNQMTRGTPLHMVTQSRKPTPERALQVSELLIQYGANAQMADGMGNLPVDAIEEGEGPLFELLTPQKPQVFLAIAEGDKEKLVALLNETNANAEFRQQTPLSLAVENLPKECGKEQLEIIDLILERGGDPNFTTKDSLGLRGESLLFTTLELLRHAFKDHAEQSISVLQDICSSLKEAGATLDDCIPLVHDAARRNQVDLLKVLFERLQVDPNTPNRQGMTALQFAARSGQMNVLQYLLGLPNINVLAQDHKGATALDAARVNDKQEAVQALQAFLDSH
jgi:ankyrin repeat protein